MTCEHIDVMSTATPVGDVRKFGKCMECGQNIDMATIDFNKQRIWAEYSVPDRIPD